MNINTRDLRFFHGTGAIAAASILSDGFRNPLDQMGWRSLASDLWSALLSLGTESELFNEYLKHEDLYDSPGLSPLRSVYAREEGHLFVYGHFFATLNIANAYRYAIRNPFRSEFLLVISTGLKLLARIGNANELESRYPAVLQLINNPPSPVVIELTGIDELRLANETGSREIMPLVENYLHFADNPSVNMPAAFRIDGVKPSDVVAVHDLSGWSADALSDSMWRPDPDRVDASRMSPERWLAEFQQTIEKPSPSSA